MMSMYRPSFFLLTTGLMAVLMLGGPLTSLSGLAAPATKPAKPKAPAALQHPATPAKQPNAVATPPVDLSSAITLTPLDLVRTPDKYLGKAVKFEAEFSGFTGLGLDYKKALRSAKDYIGLLVRRPDVSHHVIPLSELKLFYPRTKSEAINNLEAGDKVSIVATVFSNALAEPWLDVQKITVVKKKPATASK